VACVVAWLSGRLRRLYVGVMMSHNSAASETPERPNRPTSSGVQYWLGGLLRSASASPCPGSI
jgi:hypothetical protein